ncbi:hypothetical protein PIB30_075327 [Stylosanthes scabra]|uniref:Uncharacterized protein n=1 Tax=Stylosanthes scabra TaxID=79078 RepID=A0ABU6QR18_9FABA|nr:hypothetical protein [Stylosanthes scabra]
MFGLQLSYENREQREKLATTVKWSSGKVSPYPKEPPTPSVVAPDAPSAFDALSSSSTRKRNKRKRASTSEEIFDTIVESINEIKTAYQKQSSILVDMVSYFKHEQEGAEQNMKLMTLLRGVPELSVEERMKAA